MSQITLTKFHSTLNGPSKYQIFRRFKSQFSFIKKNSFDNFYLFCKAVKEIQTCEQCAKFLWLLGHPNNSLV